MRLPVWVGICFAAACTFLAFFLLAGQVYLKFGWEGLVFFVILLFVVCLTMWGRRLWQGSKMAADGRKLRAFCVEDGVGSLLGMFVPDGDKARLFNRKGELVATLPLKASLRQAVRILLGAEDVMVA